MEAHFFGWCISQLSVTITLEAGWVWWCTPIIPAIWERQRKENCSLRPGRVRRLGEWLAVLEVQGQGLMADGIMQGRVGIRDYITRSKAKDVRSSNTGSHENNLNPF
jgi:hypothetical protein